MFSVLVIESGAGFFGRRRLFKTPRVRDVRVYGGLPFREITTARRRGKINREAVYAAAGRCAGSMLLPEGTAPGGGISQPDLSDYKKLVFFNTACSLLRSACGCGVRGELLIKDKNASAARRLGIAVPLFSDIRVSTSCPEGYSRPIESAMDEFGAAVMLGESGRVAAVIDLDSSPERLICGGEIFTAGKLILPSACARLMPAGINTLEFAGALCLISRIYSLSQLDFSEIYHGGKTLSLSAASELIRLPRNPVGY